MVAVRTLLAAAELEADGPVKWGEAPSTSTAGVYLVSVSRDPDEEVGLPICSVDRAAVRTLLGVCPDAAVDGAPATEDSVVERLRQMWVPGEPVVYIGLAGASVSDRVKKYYRTKMGARSPHAGGWPIRMLANLDQLWVHYAPCSEPDGAELAMLQAFAAALEPEQRERLIDPHVVLPYANLEVTKGVRKCHGFSRVKEPRRSRAVRSQAGSSAPARPIRPPDLTL